MSSKLHEKHVITSLITSEILNFTNLSTVVQRNDLQQLVFYTRGIGQFAIHEGWNNKTTGNGIQTCLVCLHSWIRITTQNVCVFIWWSYFFEKQTAACNSNCFCIFSSILCVAFVQSLWSLRTCVFANPPSSSNIIILWQCIYSSLLQLVCSWLAK